MQESTATSRIGHHATNGSMALWSLKSDLLLNSIILSKVTSAVRQTNQIDNKAIESKPGTTPFLTQFFAVLL